MYRCLFCGYDNPSETARFCVECGPEGPAKDWTQEDIDQPAKVSQYASILSEFYFDAQTDTEVERFSRRLRERLKISHDTHASVLSKLAAQKKAIAHLANFRIEFNENVTDAYAGHDTYLSFRYTNLSEDDLFKISLLWDDPETTDRIDLRAQTSSFVKPLTTVTIGASVIFDRMGIKELADLQITIEDQFGEIAHFKAEPFSFKVGNHDQRITQNISTHNQISIEGRGVVDASGMGAEKTTAHSTSNNQPRWRELSFIYLSTAKKVEENESVTQANVAVPKPTQQKVETVDTVITTYIKANKNDLQSVQKAAEQGNADAQLALGQMYAEGREVEKDDEQAANWYRKAAEQGNARASEYIGDMYCFGNGVAQSHEKSVYWYRKGAELNDAGCQRSLGLCYDKGDGVEQDHEQAAHWYRKAAEQGDDDAQNSLGYLYQEGLGVTKDNEKAVYWYRKAAEQGDALGQNSLGYLYQEGLGVAKDNEKAVYWYRKAAEQGYPPGQNNLGFTYHEGLGVAKDNEKSVYWYRKAAEQGDAIGQSSLGYMYYEGIGVGKDLEKALYWYRKAAEQGHESAIESLKNLESFDAPNQPPTDGHGSWDYGNYSYTGLFKNGQWNGLGELTWAGKDLGHRYVGNFVNGQRTGQGTYYFPDGTIQVGTFENGVFQDPHIETDEADEDIHLTWNNGTSYVGRVENGQPEGFGTLTFANGDSMYGIFVNGIMNDETGHYDFADGGTYVGPIVDGKFYGLGTQTFGGEYDGHSYIGNFENGFFNGQGTYYFPDGSTNVGLFKDGKFVPPSTELTESNRQKALRFVIESAIKKESSVTENNLSVEDIILYYATRKIGSLGQHFYINTGDKFTKKINNFSTSFSEVHYKKLNPTTDTPLLFYDGTILGSGKDGIMFTDKYIYAKGCLERGVKHVDISYSQIINVRLSSNKVRSKEIYIESSGHAELIVLNPIYIEIEDISFIIQMLNEIICRINGA